MKVFSRLHTVRLPLKIALLPLALIFLLYYPLGMVIVHKVDDDPAFADATTREEKGSAAVAVAASVIQREISRHWTPNDPFFYPGAALTRMPAFQRGIVSAVARFTLALSDDIARTRGTSVADTDVQKAVGLLNYPPTVWIYDSSVSWLPTASSEAQYRSAVEALGAYNARLAQGQAVFDRRADNLMETLARFAADLGSSSAANYEFVNDRALFALGAASLYYETKGKLYAYYLIMRGLEKDFSGVIAEKQMEGVWKQAMKTLEQGMSLQAFFVINAAPDAFILPSHLSAQGFYLMRARTQVQEIMNILLK